MGVRERQGDGERERERDEGRKHKHTNLHYFFSFYMHKRTHLNRLAYAVKNACLRYCRVAAVR